MQINILCAAAGNYSKKFKTGNIFDASHNRNSLQQTA